VDQMFVKYLHEKFCDRFPVTEILNADGKGVHDEEPFRLPSSAVSRNNAQFIAELLVSLAVCDECVTSLRRSWSSS